MPLRRGGIEVNQTTNQETRTMKYIAGTNIPGYMPDAMPAEFDDFETARDFIADEMLRDSSWENWTDSESDLLVVASQDAGAEMEPFCIIALGRAYWVAGERG